MEKITHQGKIIEVVQKVVERNGKTNTFEFARRSPGTRLIIVKGDYILLTKEYRYENDKYDYRLPGGKVFDTLLEYHDALQAHKNLADLAKNAAIKEAREEAGIDVTDIYFFHKSICGATVVWDLYYFIVNSFNEVNQELEEGEDITIEYIDRAQ